MNEIHKDIFIENPEQYDCTLWHYQIGHREMLIRICSRDKPDESNTFFFHFIGVQYFAGPIEWHGASFQLGSNEDLMSILHRLGLTKLHQNDPEALHLMTQMFHLFEVKTASMPVKLVASRALRIPFQEVSAFISCHFV